MTGERKSYGDAVLICEGKCPSPTLHFFAFFSHDAESELSYHLYECTGCGRKRVWGCSETNPSKWDMSEEHEAMLELGVTQ